MGPGMFDDYERMMATFFLLFGVTVITVGVLAGHYLPILFNGNYILESLGGE